eukprot:CAMPEP_0206455962 /NCGR_PEP_ID=MMETSP0324_2-20121206/22084_1 /ASSEMBLY_ACC=CAM_ASM_000836 /TAXON_ID=2866 /ORGANISM="Crypthecodinium cohnii, Strain Seligo" /LENGTH=381 /DNA_ID=CAMNT_0053926805 /DNA_START=135 /DNA_END=1280 /DNA_ORIENTATION=-
MKYLALPAALLTLASAARLAADFAEESAVNFSAVELDRAANSDLIVMSWNMQDFDDKDRKSSSAADKKSKITARLTELLEDSKATVVLLQEIANCDLLDEVLKAATQYKCVPSVVDDKYEAGSFLVLGNVILYDSKVFYAPKGHTNEVLATKFWDWAKLARYTRGDAVLDSSGGSLDGAHEDMCNDKTLGWIEFGKKPCDLLSDLQSATSVLLKPKSGKWTEPATEALKEGILFVDIHLFSGKSSGLTQQQNGQRRAFQFRTHVWRTKYWQKQSGTTYPTIYAGDFNSGNAAELKKVIAEQSAAYDVDMSCLLEGAQCKDVEEKQMKPTLGKNYPLDHVILDKTGVPSTVTFSVASTKVYQIDRSIADHAPIAVKMTLEER